MRRRVAIFQLHLQQRPRMKTKRREEPCHRGPSSKKHTQSTLPLQGTTCTCSSINIIIIIIIAITYLRSISIRYNEHVGRHVVATRNIAAGEVIFHEDPIVSVLIQEDDASTEACHHCFLFLHLIVPCPTCSFVVFCSLQCRNEALATYHKTECKLGPVLRSCKLDRLPLITMVLR